MAKRKVKEVGEKIKDYGVFGKWGISTLCAQSEIYPSQWIDCYKDVHLPEAIKNKYTEIDETYGQYVNKKILWPTPEKILNIIFEEKLHSQRKNTYYKLCADVLKELTHRMPTQQFRIDYF